MTISSALVTAVLLGAVEPSAQVMIENRSSRPFFYHLLRADVNAWSGRRTIPAGESQAIPAAQPVVIGHYRGDQWASYRLEPGKVFRWQPDAAGADRLYDAGPATGAPAGEARGRKPGLRDIRVFGYADESYRRRFPEWDKRIGELLARASRHFEKTFQVRFTLVDSRPWGYDARLDAGEHLASRLIAINPWSADLVIAFVGAVQPLAKARVHQSGWYAPFGQHVAIADLRREQKYGAEQLLVRLLCGVFGAFPVVDHRSVMNGKMENIESPGIEFGPVADEVIGLTRNFDFRRGPASLSPAAILRIRELYQSHRHPECRPESDPVSEGLRYRTARRARPHQLDV